MAKRISAVDARHGLGTLMNEVQLKGEHYIIERAGKPLVAVIPVEQYDAWRKFQGLIAADDAQARYPLRGTVVKYDDPFRGVGEDIWESSQ